MKKMLSKILLAAAAFGLFFSGCEKKPDVNPVAIIGMDGMDWQIIRSMIDAGELPNVKKILEGGVSAEMVTLEPILSPAIWTTIATGVLPETHGITWFLVKDANGQMMPVTSQQRRVKALWNIATENKRDVDVVGWWATWPSERVRGRIVSDHMGYHIFAIQSDNVDTDLGNTYPPGMADKMTQYEIDPFDIPLDEVRRYMKISDLEYNVSIDMKSLCQRPEYRNCLYCTGESKVPFCHFNPLHHFLRALATLETFSDISLAMLKEKQPDLFMVYFEWVDVVSHQYMKFAPPQMEWVNDEQYRKYSDVIRQTYMRQDEVLGQLLALLKPNTNVLIMSDHGFKTGDERLTEDKVTTVAKAHLWHRQPAFLAMYGPDFRTGGKKVEARVQDIAPTVLTLMALPVADDMEGGVIKDAIQPAFLQKHPIQRIETYETTKKDITRVATVDTDINGSNIDAQIKEKLKAMGYIGDVDDTGLEMSRVRLLMEKGKFKEAAKVAEQIRQRDPNNIRTIAMLGDLYFQMKQFNNAVEILSSIEDIPEEDIPPGADMIVTSIIANWGVALMNLGNLTEAEERCQQAVARNSTNYLAQFCMGRIAEIRQETDKAIAYYKETVKLNSSSAEAQNNLGNCYFRKDMYEQAIEQYKKASEANPAHVESHHNAAIAYQKLGKLDKAAEEFEAALKLNPMLVPSINELANLRMEQGKYEEAAEVFLRLVDVQPSNPGPLYQAARAYMQGGLKDKAIETLKKARNINPTAIENSVRNDPVFAGISPDDLK